MKHFGSFALDVSNQCLWKGGELVPLPPKPFAVLQYLVEHPGRLISHDELLDALWPETYVQPQVLRTYMLDLRKALGDDARQPLYIQSLPKRGYRFVAEVGEREQAAPSPGASTENPPSHVPGIIGRTSQLGTLHEHLRHAQSAQRQVIFITGDSGIGKTALATAFGHQLSAASAVAVATGHCVQGFGSHEQYYPVMEALAQLCASPDGDRACKVLAQMAPTWLALLGRDTGASTQLPEDRRPNQLCIALEELALEKPLVLFFEDLQWADDSTLNLISALARRTTAAQLMVVVTCTPRSARSESPLRRLKQDLLVHRLACEIALGPLSRGHITEILQTTLGQSDLPSGLDRFVHEHSEGNPLFAIAILEHLIAQRFLVRAKDDPVTPWKQRTPFQQMEAGVPDQLAQMIELEIGDLSPREQSVLEAGSLFSVAFPSWAVAAALATDLAQIEEECNAIAERLHYVRRGGQDELPDGTTSSFYIFAHGLYREVLHQRQPAARRARSHARIAERLGEVFAGREMDVARELAMHHEGAGNWQRAAETLRIAARHARQRNAFTVAEDLMAHALQVAENLAGSARDAAVQGIVAELQSLRDLVQHRSAELTSAGSKA